jgi:drug/metabolite transporter (DMT)-like permease
MQGTPNWRLGLLFASTTAAAWGCLPIALKTMLMYMDPYTITWYRFLVSAIVAALVLRATGGLPRLGRLRPRSRGVLLVAVLGLIGNYLLYLIGLSFASPGSTQVLIQLAPMFLLVGGLVIFRESFSTVQWLGLATLLGGLGLFFHDRFPAMIDLDADLGKGVFLIVLASLVWAIYAIAQKILQLEMSPQGILLVIYVSASIALLPTADPAALVSLTPWTLGLLAFCSLNTLVAYGAFAEALRHWEASRVSAVLAVTPLLTLGFGVLLASLPTGYVNEDPSDPTSLAGAALVVVGSAVTALGGMRRRPATD